MQRAIRTRVLETYPQLTPYIDSVLPKKSQLEVVKLPERVSLYALGSTPLFFQHMDDPLIPHLRLVHQYPHCFPTVGVDRGAIRFVLSGATLMAPGLTSKGGRLPNQKPGEEEGGERELEKGEVVVVTAEGKDHACLVGVLSMGTAEVKREKKGVVLEAGHYLGDGLWRMSLD